MSQQYAKDQPQGFKNYVENIAIVGAGGRVGAFVAHELLKTKKHKVTALSRPESTSKLPADILVKHISYDDPSSLVDALRGQDALIITMSVMAPPDQEAKLIQAAADAGVPWVMPNEWGLDPSMKDLAKESLIGEPREKARNLITSLGKSSFISLVVGFWYEFSLGGLKYRYGFDIPGREVTFYDDGNTKINTSTWQQCGRAAAAVFSLKVLPEDEADKAPTLSQFKNGFVYVSSFLVSQRDMFASVLRVTGTSEKDWTIKYQDVEERYKEGVEEMKAGDVFKGFTKLLYARDFYPDGCGNYEARKGLHNDLLGLPKEDLDECTKVAVVIAENGEEAGRL
ncbi:hypothetical protein A1O1_04908 [Capronia coronata CBS 617.96]|uniref:NmrA-like domain-containing protein n=1 Tax=Capronia coronata CBS 617.96 TaxID=1182541 RepID=W9YFF7_9EURO|nr:uncharacterized protein A1O1_04908 [Capronia coronata CBS 617.96]EXJ87981.1 hypothetical protein A1O1_04908 [Capronia coronata CBS 617.96]